jgi:hypothetical protein
MDAQIQPQEYAEVTAQDAGAVIDGTEPGTLVVAPTPKAEDKFEEVGRNVSNFLEQFPVYVNRFFQEYKLPIISFGLLVVAITVLKIAVAVLDAINDIPLVYPIFELIGIGYTTWFISRYLLKASNRQELVADFRSFREDITGNKSSESLN